MKGSIALLVSGLAAQQVVATWDYKAPTYNTPQYNNNECSDKQKGGYSWDGLKDGDKDFDYDGFSFKGGWTCANSFGKRDSLTKRTFGGKCIKNSASKEMPASFSCGSKKDGFSVTHMQVSVDHDVDLNFHYKMGDGSTCKQTASCKKEGTTVENTQCGGAQSVEVYLGHSSQGKSSCEIGFHSIGFECSPSKSYSTPVYSPTPKPSCGSGYGQKPCEESSKTTPTPSPKCGSGYGQKPCEESKTPSPTPSPSPSCGSEYGQKPCETPKESSTPSPSPSPSPSCGSGYGQTPCETPKESTTPPPSSYPPSSSPPSESPSPSASCGTGYGQTPCESSAPPSSSATPSSSASPSPSPSCGSGYGQTPCETPKESSSSSVAPSTSPSPSPSPSCGNGYGQTPCESSKVPTSEYPSSTPPSASSSSPSPSPSTYVPPGGYTPPQVLPKCLNSWLQINTQCKDNTDSACYCTIVDFTKNVVDCVAAYGSQEEAQQALQYFIGICASYIPQNPGIITNCPSNIPINPTTPATSAAPTTPAGSTAAPTTPAPTAPSVPCTTITYGSTSYTVPQVVFTTQTPTAPGVTPTAPVQLVPGTPAPVTATTTGAPYPLPSGFSSVTVPAGTTGLTPAPSQFTGAASPLNVQVKGALFGGAVLAFFAL